MKITCLQENLAQGMDYAFGSVPLRTTLPVLTNFLLQAKDVRLVITGSDLSTVVTNEMSAQVEVVITLPARRANEFIRTFLDGVLEIRTEPEDVGDGGWLARITSERSTTHFNYADPEDYPAVPTVKTAEISVSTSPDTLLDGIRRVLPAIAAEDSRPVLATTRMEMSGEGLCMVGADGYRLSIFECGLEERLDDSEDDGMVELLNPRRTVVELEKLLRRYTQPVQMAPTETHAVFRIGDTEVVSAVVKGASPNYRDLIPSEWKTRVVVEKEALSGAARSMAAFGDGGTGTVRIRLVAEQDDTNGGGFSAFAERPSRLDLETAPSPLVSRETAGASPSTQSTLPTRWAHWTKTRRSNSPLRRSQVFSSPPRMRQISPSPT